MLKSVGSKHFLTFSALLSPDRRSGGVNASGQAVAKGQWFSARHRDAKNKSNPNKDRTKPGKYRKNTIVYNTLETLLYLFWVCCIVS